MKGRFVKAAGTILAVLLSLVVVDAVMAGGIINKNNQSADYMRTLNRAAATDYADIAVYNPAGSMQMEDGFYGKVDVMYYDKDYTNTVPGYGELSQDEPSITPGVFSIYKKKKWGGFLAFTVPAGGGKLDYEDGNARTVDIATGVAEGVAPGANSNVDDMKIEVKKSSVYGFTLGGSYSINDAWSVALGARYATGKREFEGGATITIPAVNVQLNPQIHLEEDADGWAGIVGVNFAPNDKLNAALTYISNTKMDYEMDVKVDNYGVAASKGWTDGSTRRIDLPAQLGTGVSYRFLPPLKVDLTYTYYFEKDADIDTYADEGNSWDLGISGEYTFNPRWKASLGYMLTRVDLDDDEQISEPEEPKLGAHAVAAGAVWSPTQRWAITLGGAYIMYDGVEDSQGREYDKTIWNVSLGLQYKFL
ncbi:membrane protein, predicted to be involved in aromatic hydrocarbon degradation [Desulfosarcina variabilis str. Montpellier]|uniref:OmpP1/FadL family transporter n=1 Tax=Desulfosarcina variabilis TaxID=2300 RepID=UPI003AFAB9E7